MNFYQAISLPDEVPDQEISGELFLPDDSAPVPCVIVVPGSLGVAPSHLAHAQTFVEMGYAACVIDPFGARSVSSTVANQTQYSFAASAWDVLATCAHLAAREEIDASRIGAQGHSRGGSAVMTAASRVFSRRFEHQLKAIYAAYPWCGHQFLDPSVDSTIVRAVIGDQDEWCLPQQVQAQVHSMRVVGGDASVRIFSGCQHSFDRDTPVELIADASVSPAAPTTFITDSGAFVHPVSGDVNPDWVDRDMMVYALKAGYGSKGARIGSEPGQADLFRQDMRDFWRNSLG